MIIDELIAILGYDVKGEGELDRFNRGLDRAQMRAQAVANRINAMSVAIGSFVGVIATQAALRLGSAVGSIPGDILKVGQAFENLETVLTTIEGSSTKAKEAMDWVQDFAATTPYDLNQVSEAFVRMRAYGLDPMSGQLRSIGDAAAGMGKSLMQGVEAIADAVTGENERLKEFGIKAKVQGDQITYNWNENGKEMSKTVRKNGPEIIAALTEIFGRFDGAMDKLSKTQAGILSNLGDTWTGFLKTIGEKGYYDEVTRRLGGVQDTIARWDKNGVLDRIAGGISDALVGAINFGAHVGSQFIAVGKAAYYAADGIVELVSRVSGLNKAASAGVVGAAVLGSSKLGRAAMLALAKRIPAMAALLMADDIITALNGGDSYIGKMEGGKEAIDDLRTSFADLGKAISDLVPQFDALGKLDPSNFVNKELLNFVRELTQGLRELAIIVTAIRQGDWKLAGSMLFHGTDKDNLGKIEDYQGRKNREDKARKSQDDGNGFRDMLGGMGGPEGKRQSNAVEGNAFVKMLAAMERVQANLNKQGADAAAVVTDNRQDNRDQSTHVNVGGVNVNVQGAAAAPAATGAAVGAAVGRAAIPQANRLKIDSAF